MSDLPPLFIATDEGAMAVIRAARRRRWRRASAAASASLVLAGGGVGIALQHHPRDRDRLSVTEGPAPSYSPPAGSAAPIPIPPAPPSTGGTTAAAGAATGIGGRVVRNGTASAATAVSAGPVISPPPQVAGPPRVSPIWRTNGRIATTDICDDDALDATSGWCVRYLGPGVVHRGHDATISFEVCRRPAFSAATFRFTSTREIQMQLQGGSPSRRVWAAGEGVHYRQPGPTVTLPAGRCLIWHSTWDTRDETGSVVKRGSYFVQFSVDSNHEIYDDAFIEVTK